MGERIAERLEALGGRSEGFSQAWLARSTGLSQPTINGLIRQPGTGSKHLAKIAKALRTTVPYLLGEVDDPGADLPKLSIDSAKQFLGIAMVPELSHQRLALGGGAEAEDIPYERRVPFRQAWLREVTSAGQDGVFLAVGEGDSMIPTILDGDHVLVERTPDAIDRQDAIWAIAYGGFLMIKRVRRLPDGRYHLISDNPAVSAIEAVHDELKFIGRVVWVGRKM